MKLDVLALTALFLVAVGSFWLDPERDGPLATTVDARVRAGVPAASQSPAASAPSLWDPYEFGGRPRIVEPQTFLYPPILRQWVSDTWLTLVSVVLHVWLAGVAFYTAARHLGAKPLAGSALAAGLMLTTVLALPASQSSAEVLFRSAWLPLLAAACLASSSHSVWMPRLPVVAIGVVIAAAGSPRTQAYGLAALAGAYVLGILWTAGSRWRTAAQGALAAAFIIALSGPVSIPTLHAWGASELTGGLASSEPLDGSWRTNVSGSVGIDPDLANALRQLRPARVISGCPARVDAIHLRALGVRSVGGYGGVFAADYARFVNLVRNQLLTTPLPYVGLSDAHDVRVRRDLLQFLDAEYLLLCERIDQPQWEPIRSIGDVHVHRARRALGGPFWTCAPAHVGRKEIEYRLATRRYDTTLSLTGPWPKVNVRWAADVDDEARAAAEQTFDLNEIDVPDNQTRHYELLDPSLANVEALVKSPLVEDTAGVDRATFVVDALPDAQFDERPTEWLLGLKPCPEVRPVQVVERTEDGQITVDVDAPAAGVVFFSETFYPSRMAFVDDRPADVVNVNLAFTAVAVPPGHHRVRLGVRSGARYVGWITAVVALTGWGAASWIGRRHEKKK